MRGSILLLSLAAAASATVFQDCGSAGSDVTMYVEGCDIPPCILHRGQAINVGFEFTASRHSETLELDASASIGGISIPWPGVDNNACLHTTCPFEAGSRVVWSMPVDILSEYPALTTIVTFKLEDETGEPQTCAVLPATIV